MRVIAARTALVGLPAIAVLGIVGLVATGAAGRSSTSMPAASIPVQSAAAPSVAVTTSRLGQTTVTGRPLYELSETEFVFSAGGTTYHVTMDIDTRCVNSRGKLLGGYQFVSRIAMITSLPLTITGTLDGTNLMARTILLPTTKDAIT